jgi:hypothetical protein
MTKVFNSVQPSLTPFLVKNYAVESTFRFGGPSHGCTAYMNIPFVSFDDLFEFLVGIYPCKDLLRLFSPVSERVVRASNRHHLIFRAFPSASSTVNQVLPSAIVESRAGGLPEGRSTAEATPKASAASTRRRLSTTGIRTTHSKAGPSSEMNAQGVLDDGDHDGRSPANLGTMQPPSSESPRVMVNPASASISLTPGSTSKAADSSPIRSVSLTTKFNEFLVHLVDYLVDSQTALRNHRGFAPDVDIFIVNASGLTPEGCVIIGGGGNPSDVAAAGPNAMEETPGIYPNKAGPSANQGVSGANGDPGGNPGAGPIRPSNPSSTIELRVYFCGASWNTLTDLCAALQPSFQSYFKSDGPGNMLEGFDFSLEVHAGRWCSLPGFIHKHPHAETASGPAPAQPAPPPPPATRIQTRSQKSRLASSYSSSSSSTPSSSVLAQVQSPSLTSLNSGSGDLKSGSAVLPDVTEEATPQFVLWERVRVDYWEKTEKATDIDEALVSFVELLNRVCLLLSPALRMPKEKGKSKRIVGKVLRRGDHAFLVYIWRRKERRKEYLGTYRSRELAEQVAMQHVEEDGDDEPDRRVSGGPDSGNLVETFSSNDALFVDYGSGGPMDLDQRQVDAA